MLNLWMGRPWPSHKKHFHPFPARHAYAPLLLVLAVFCLQLVLWLAVILSLTVACHLQEACPYSILLEVSSTAAEARTRDRLERLVLIMCGLLNMP